MTSTLSGIGQVVAGAYANTRLSLPVDQNFDLVGLVAVWELLDQDGRVWNRGEVSSITIEDSQTLPGTKIISSEASVGVPSSVPTNHKGTMYQIRWTLVQRGGQKTQSFETFTVMPAVDAAQGALDAIEMFGDPIGVRLRLPKQYTVVKYTPYQGNSKIGSEVDARYDGPDADGFLYSAVIPPETYTRAALDPITVVWSYKDSASDMYQRETSQAFIVTPIIMDAAQELQNWLNRAYIDGGLDPGTTFTPLDFVKYLRTGRDAFNAAAVPTNFTMTAADGPIRWFWLAYSSIAAARAQYLAEGMKAFNYSGPATQLDVDRTQYWEQVAAGLEQAVDQNVKPFKDNLAKRGNTEGDGSNSLSLKPGAIGCIGISRHRASPMGSYGYGNLVVPVWR